VASQPKNRPSILFSVFAHLKKQWMPLRQSLELHESPTTTFDIFSQQHVSRRVSTFQPFHAGLAIAMGALSQCAPAAI